MQATLRAIRVHLGISIDEAARRIGIPKNRLIAIGKHRTCPSWQLIKRFMRVYDIPSVDNLLVSNRKNEIKLYYKYPHDAIIKCSSKEVNEVCSK